MEAFAGEITIRRRARLHSALDGLFGAKQGAARTRRAGLRFWYSCPMVRKWLWRWPRSSLGEAAAMGRVARNRDCYARARDPKAKSPPRRRARCLRPSLGMSCSIAMVELRWTSAALVVDPGSRQHSNSGRRGNARHEKMAPARRETARCRGRPAPDPCAGAPPTLAVGHAAQKKTRLRRAAICVQRAKGPQEATPYGARRRALGGAR